MPLAVVEARTGFCTSLDKFTEEKIHWISFAVLETIK